MARAGCEFYICVLSLLFLLKGEREAALPWGPEQGAEFTLPQRTHGVSLSF